MKQIGIRAVFMRGGTSKAVMFRTEDLPAERGAWAPIFLSAIGSPDPYGRQLDGMGGGISSLSKVCVIGPPSRPDADVDYTFAQVSVKDALVDYSGNCGNMSSAVGPFAVDEGLVPATGSEAMVRIHNTNTRKIIVSRFPLDDGKAAVDGDFILPGVGGTGASIQLEFMMPGGAGTGRLLPTGHVVDRLDVPGIGAIEASLVDAANPCVFVPAATLEQSGIEMPETIDANHTLTDRLEEIRLAASVRMGIAESIEHATRIPSIPKVGMVTQPVAAKTLSGEKLDPDAMDVLVRMISVGQAHRAVPLTAALCIATAARIAGSTVHRATREPAKDADQIRIAHPSGLTVVGASVRHDGEWIAESASVYRTARRLMEGTIYVRAAALSDRP
jgi:2-methylaconitate cis-trans-isomerase PrpF